MAGSWDPQPVRFVRPLGTRQPPPRELRPALARCEQRVAPGGRQHRLRRQWGAAALRPNRYYDRVILDAARVCRDVGRIAEQAIAHLAGLIGAKATVTLEVEAAVPGGVQEHVVQNVTEKGWTLHEPGL
jgi:hypothetical protein